MSTFSVLWVLTWAFIWKKSIAFSLLTKLDETYVENVLQEGSEKTAGHFLVGMTGNNTLILGNCHINFTYFPHVPSFLPFAKQQIAMPSDDFLQILPFGARAWSNGCLLNAKKFRIEVETYFCCPHIRGVRPLYFPSKPQSVFQISSVKQTFFTWLQIMVSLKIQKTRNCSYWHLSLWYSGFFLEPPASKVSFSFS